MSNLALTRALGLNHDFAAYAAYHTQIPRSLSDPTPLLNLVPLQLQSQQPMRLRDGDVHFYFPTVEPLTDITIESFIAHLAAVLFVQRGVDETIVMMDETYNRAQTDTPSDPVNLVGGAFDFQEGSDPSGTDDEMPFLIPDVD